MKKTTQIQQYSTLVPTCRDKKQSNDKMHQSGIRKTALCFSGSGSGGLAPSYIRTTNIQAEQHSYATDKPSEAQQHHGLCSTEE